MHILLLFLLATDELEFTWPTMFPTIPFTDILMMSPRQWLTQNQRSKPRQEDVEGVTCEFSASSNGWANSFSFLFSSVVTKLFKAGLLLAINPFESCSVWSVSFVFCISALSKDSFILFTPFLSVCCHLLKIAFLYNTSSKANSRGAAITWVWAETASIKPWYHCVRTSSQGAINAQVSCLDQLGDTFGILLSRMSPYHHPSAIPYREQFAAISMLP